MKNESHVDCVEACFQRALWIVVGIVYATIGKGYQVIFAYIIDAWCDVFL